MAVVRPGILIAVCIASMASAAERTGSPSTTAVIRLSDVAPALRERLPPGTTSQEGFDRYVASLDRETEARERAGEYEHLIYFLLQSQVFTREPRIEPALSAYELLHGVDLADAAPRITTPPAVARRLSDFIHALEGTPRDARLAYFKRFLETQPAGAALADQLRAEYVRVMRFLYQKEFLAQGLADPQKREAFLASLYETRGHSTDTQIEANFAVYTALSVIGALGERRMDKVLVVGPGLDFAPRTDFIDLFGPQSYQPFAVADALLALGLSDSARLQIDCVDVSQRVLAYLRGLASAGPLRLRLLSGIAERQQRRFEPDYREYFTQFGRRIGEEAPLERPLPGRLGKSVLVRPEIVRAISAQRLDIITQRLVPSPAYDLVVVTNVLGYFDSAQQTLALSNIEAMLKDGGYLVHNEPRSSLVAAASALGLPMIDARTVRVASDPQAPLFDRVLIHRRSCQPGKGRPTDGPSKQEGL